MAQKIIAYADDSGTLYGLSVEESLFGAWLDFAEAAGQTLAAPYNTTYATLAALQAISGWSGAIAFPAGLSPRVQSIGLAEASGNQIATVQAPVGNKTVYAALEPTGAAPYPTTAYTLTGMKASIVGVAGEQRSGN
jgi:hypothetical protein